MWWIFLLSFSLFLSLSLGVLALPLRLTFLLDVVRVSSFRADSTLGMSQFLCHDVLTITAAYISVMDAIRLRQVSRDCRKAVLETRKEVPTVEDLHAAEQAWNVTSIPREDLHTPFDDAFKFKFEPLAQDAEPQGDVHVLITTTPSLLAVWIRALAELDDQQPVIRAAGKLLGRCYLQPTPKPVEGVAPHALINFASMTYVSEENDDPDLQYLIEEMFSDGRDDFNRFWPHRDVERTPMREFLDRTFNASGMFIGPFVCQDRSCIRPSLCPTMFPREEDPENYVCEYNFFLLAIRNDGVVQAFHFGAISSD